VTAKELQAWQDRLGLTQVEAAAELKMSPQGYRHLLAGRYCAGIANPMGQSLIQIQSVDGSARPPQSLVERASLFSR